MAEDVAYDNHEAGSVVAYVRSLIPDMEELPDPQDPTLPNGYLFDDATIARFIAFARRQHPKRAAADACDSIAGSELLILKKITTEDLSTDASVLANQWGAKATRLRKEAAEDEEDEERDDNAGIVTSQYLRRPIPFDPQAIIGTGSRYGYRRY